MQGVHSSVTGQYCLISFCMFLLIDKLTGFIPDARSLGILNLIANFSDNSAHGATVVINHSCLKRYLIENFLFSSLGRCIRNFSKRKYMLYLFLSSLILTSILHFYFCII